MRVIERKLVYPGRSLLVKPLSELQCGIHCHKELELIVVDRGEGSLYMGNGKRTFQPGTILFIGGNLPHAFHLILDWKREDLEGWILQFPESALPESLIKMPECAILENVLSFASRGLISNDVVLEGKMSDALCEMMSSEGLSRVSLFFKVLELLCSRNHSTMLTLPYREERIVEQLDDPVGKVNQFIQQHYTERIKLEELAKIAGLSNSAFCRYYKKRTHLTPFEYLARVRVSHSTRILMNSDRTVAEIAYECGYAQVTLFDRHFARIMGQSPSSYRKTLKRIGTE